MAEKSILDLVSEPSPAALEAALTRACEESWDATTAVVAMLHALPGGVVAIDGFEGAFDVCGGHDDLDAYADGLLRYGFRGVAAYEGEGRGAATYTLYVADHLVVRLERFDDNGAIVSIFGAESALLA